MQVGLITPPIGQLFKGSLLGFHLSSSVSCCVGARAPGKWPVSWVQLGVGDGAEVLEEEGSQKGATGGKELDVH